MGMIPLPSASVTPRDGSGRTEVKVPFHCGGLLYKDGPALSTRQVLPLFSCSLWPQSLTQQASHACLSYPPGDPERRLARSSPSWTSFLCSLEGVLGSQNACWRQERGKARGGGGSQGHRLSSAISSLCKSSHFTFLSLHLLICKMDLIILLH